MVFPCSKEDNPWTHNFDTMALNESICIIRFVSQYSSNSNMYSFSWSFDGTLVQTWMILVKIVTQLVIVLSKQLVHIFTIALLTSSPNHPHYQLDCWGSKTKIWRFLPHSETALDLKVVFSIIFINCHRLVEIDIIIVTTFITSWVGEWANGNNNRRSKTQVTTTPGTLGIRKACVRSRILKAIKRSTTLRTL